MIQKFVSNRLCLSDILLPMSADFFSLWILWIRCMWSLMINKNLLLLQTLFLLSSWVPRNISFQYSFFGVHCLVKSGNSLKVVEASLWYINRYFLPIIGNCFLRNHYRFLIKKEARKHAFFSFFNRNDFYDLIVIDQDFCYDFPFISSSVLHQNF